MILAVNTYSKSSRERLSRNFSVPEYRCHGTGCCNAVLIDTELVDIEQDLRDHFGVEVTNTSAYRCPIHNRSVGGAVGSRHTKGQAADFVVAGIAPRKAAQYLESRGVRGIGLYETQADGFFVHVDTRTKKSFWYGQGQAYRATFGAYVEKPGLPAEPPAVYPRTQFIRDVQRAIGASVDGLGGPETLGKTPTLAAWCNFSHPAVLPVQKYLAAMGFNVGKPDGVAGPKFTAAVKEYQRKTWCEYQDGELTAGKETWRKLLGM